VFEEDVLSAKVGSTLPDALTDISPRDEEVSFAAGEKLDSPYIDALVGSDESGTVVDFTSVTSADSRFLSCNTIYRRL
tara:strand:- start:367 stop:600 length:234 start_codon:yes stop_codon:yes gene_type:complete